MTTIRVHPSLIIAAKRQHLGGAIRLYALAKSIHPYGWLTVSELKAESYKVGISKSSFYNWLKDAYSTDLFHYVCDKQGRELILVASYADAYTIFEIQFVDKQAVEIPADVLFDKDWFAFVWEGWNASNFNGRVISQDTKQKLTGIPAPTQRRLDRRANIKRVRNYVVTDVPASQVEAVREFSNKRGVFTIGNHVAFCIPSISVVNEPTAKPTGSIRLRRNLSAIVRSYSNAETGDVKLRRLFCENDKQAGKIQKTGEIGYRFSKHHGSFNVWKII
jgi:hypothetical protein